MADMASIPGNGMTPPQAGQPVQRHAPSAYKLLHTIKATQERLEAASAAAQHPDVWERLHEVFNPAAKAAREARKSEAKDFEQVVPEMYALIAKCYEVLAGDDGSSSSGLTPSASNTQKGSASSASAAPSADVASAPTATSAAAAPEAVPALAAEAASVATATSSSAPQAAGA